MVHAGQTQDGIVCTYIYASDLFILTIEEVQTLSVLLNDKMTTIFAPGSSWFTLVKHMVRLYANLSVHIYGSYMFARVCYNRHDAETLYTSQRQDGDSIRFRLLMVHARQTYGEVICKYIYIYVYMVHICSHAFL